MPKWKNSYDTGRKYNKAWEKSYPWLKSADDGRRAYCVLCKVTVLPKQCSILAHEKTKHQDKTPNRNISQRSLDNFIRTKSNDQEKEAEI